MAETQPQVFWEVCLLEAAQARERRQWATLDLLLDRARGAPDAPSLDDEDREDVRTWHALHIALVGHHCDAGALIRAAVHLLLTRAQDRFGAVGAPDPSVQELCAWLRTEAETLATVELDAVDEEVEERWRGPQFPRRWLRRPAWDYDPWNETA